MPKLDRYGLPFVKLEIQELIIPIMFAPCSDIVPKDSASYLRIFSQINYLWTCLQSALFVLASSLRGELAAHLVFLL